MLYVLNIQRGFTRRKFIIIFNIRFFPYLNFFRNEILKNCNYTDNC